MSLIGQNIKKIRSVRKLNQTEFADKFGLSRTSVGAYEEGRAEPKIDTIIQIANHFGISVDFLLTRDLTINEVLHFDKELVNKQENVSALPSNISASSQIPLIQPEHVISYMTHYKDKEFLSTVPFFVFPGYHRDFHRAFTFTGANIINYSSLNLETNDVLFCKRLPVQAIKKNNTVLFHTSNRLEIGSVSDKTKSYITIKGHTNNFVDLEIETKNLIEAWEVVGVLAKTKKISSETDQRLAELEIRISRLENK